MMTETAKTGETCTKAGYYTFMCYEDGSVAPDPAHGEYDIAIHVGVHVPHSQIMQ